MAHTRDDTHIFDNIKCQFMHAVTQDTVTMPTGESARVSQLQLFQYRMSPVVKLRQLSDSDIRGWIAHKTSTVSQSSRRKPKRTLGHRVTSRQRKSHSSQNAPFDSICEYYDSDKSEPRTFRSKRPRGAERDVEQYNVAASAFGMSGLSEQSCTKKSKLQTSTSKSSTVRLNKRKSRTSMNNATTASNKDDSISGDGDITAAMLNEVNMQKTKRITNAKRTQQSQHPCGAALSTVHTEAAVARLTDDKSEHRAKMASSDTHIVSSAADLEKQSTSGIPITSVKPRCQHDNNRCRYQSSFCNSSDTSERATTPYVKRNVENAETHQHELKNDKLIRSTNASMCAMESCDRVQGKPAFDSVCLLKPSGMVSTLLETDNPTTTSGKIGQCEPQSNLRSSSKSVRNPKSPNSKRSPTKSNGYNSMLKFLNGHKHLQSKLASTFANKPKGPLTKSPSKEPPIQSLHYNRSCSLQKKTVGLHSNTQLLSCTKNSAQLYIANEPVKANLNEINVDYELHIPVLEVAGSGPSQLKLQHIVDNQEPAATPLQVALDKSSRHISKSTTIRTNKAADASHDKLIPNNTKSSSSNCKDPQSCMISRVPTPGHEHTESILDRSNGVTNYECVPSSSAVSPCTPMHGDNGNVTDDDQCYGALQIDIDENEHPDMHTKENENSTLVDDQVNNSMQTSELSLESSNGPAKGNATVGSHGHMYQKHGNNNKLLTHKEATAQINKSGASEKCLKSSIKDTKRLQLCFPDPVPSQFCSPDAQLENSVPSTTPTKRGRKRRNTSGNYRCY